MRYYHGLLLLIFPIILAGCARYPVTPVVNNAPPRTVYSEIAVAAGQFNTNDYYFFAVGTDQTNATGPLPVVTGTELGNGWGIIGPLAPSQPVEQPPFYIQYFNGTFSEWRLAPPATPGATPQYQFISAPYRYGLVPRDDGEHLYVEFNQEDITGPGNPIPQFIQFNWITMQQIATKPQDLQIAKQYDGIGPYGNSYVLLNLNVTGSYYSGDSYGSPLVEPYNQQFPNGGPYQTWAQDPYIDLTYWRTDVNIRQ